MSRSRFPAPLSKEEFEEAIRRRARHPITRRAIYGTTVSIDAQVADFWVIRATNGTAFTIANPLNPLEGQILTISLWNDSGGALGAITLSGDYKVSGAFPSPANTKRQNVTFQREGVRWREIARTAADQDN